MSPDEMLVASRPSGTWTAPGRNQGSAQQYGFKNRLILGAFRLGLFESGNKPGSALRLVRIVFALYLARTKPTSVVVDRKKRRIGAAINTNLLGLYDASGRQSASYISGRLRDALPDFLHCSKTKTNTGSVIRRSGLSTCQQKKHEDAKTSENRFCHTRYVTTHFLPQQILADRMVT